MTMLNNLDLSLVFDMYALHKANELTLPTPTPNVTLSLREGGTKVLIVHL